MREGDLVLAEIGGRVQAVAVAGLRRNWVCGPGVLHLRLRPEVPLLPGFAAWQLNQPPLAPLLRQLQVEHGRLSFQPLQVLTLQLPPLAQQAGIEAVLRLMRSQRQAQARLHALWQQRLERLAQRLLEPAAPLARPRRLEDARPRWMVPEALLPPTADPFQRELAHQAGMTNDRVSPGATARVEVG